MKQFGALVNIVTKQQGIHNVPINAIYARKFKQNINQYQYQLIYESATNLVAIMRHKHVRCVFCIN